MVSESFQAPASGREARKDAKRAGVSNGQYVSDDTSNRDFLPLRQDELMGKNTAGTPAVAPLSSVTATDSPPILFLLPGSVGYGPSLAAFAADMSKVTRVVPIKYPGLRLILNGQNTLAAMAADAMQQIGRAQPSGDVRLLGHSLGGVVAYEVARRLLGAGRSVRFLGLLDTSLEGERSTYRELITRTFHRLRSNRVAVSRVACRALAKGTAAMGHEARLAGMLERYTKERFNATCFRIQFELQEVLRQRAFFAWLGEPKQQLPLAGTLFRCKREGMTRELGWDSALAGVEVIPIAGGHLDLVMEPHLSANRPLIEQAVARSYSPTTLHPRERRLPM
ncbi:thioesterase domain-containing protein [Bosea sp. BIWAKO-01]|uniref:thioesterase domain-containing protein n=1 Tax=Bosea sp. BIWAKO-01 TaxID=506668 RepID=UPI0009FBDFBF|nr:thioesterase domain-containing protein [Bosea sp. BIWAKO-01]